MSWQFSFRLVAGAQSSVCGSGQVGAGPEDSVWAAVAVEQAAVEEDLVLLDALLQGTQRVRGLLVEAEAASDLKGLPEAAAMAETGETLEGAEKKGAKSALVEDGDARYSGGPGPGRRGAGWRRNALLL